MKQIKISLFAPLFFLASCTKGELEKAPDCEAVTFYSDKYTLDSVYLRSDLRMEQREVCGTDLQNCKAANYNPSLKLCEIGLLEIHRYKIGNTFSKPKLFK